MHVRESSNPADRTGQRKREKDGTKEGKKGKEREKRPLSVRCESHHHASKERDSRLQGCAEYNLRGQARDMRPHDTGMGKAGNLCVVFAFAHGGPPPLLCRLPKAISRHVLPCLCLGLCAYYLGSISLLRCVLDLFFCSALSGCFALRSIVSLVCRVSLRSIRETFSYTAACLYRVTSTQQ